MQAQKFDKRRVKPQIMGPGEFLKRHPDKPRDHIGQIVLPIPDADFVKGKHHRGEVIQQFVFKRVMLPVF